MGRPPLPVGTAGDIITRVDGEKWKARVYIRDADGRRRELARWAPTKTAAERAVKEALRDRVDPAQGHAGITPETRLSALAEAWLEDVGAARMATNSKQLYRDAVTNYVLPALGGYQLRELSVGRVDTALRSVRTHKGPGAAKTMRSTLSGMLGKAVRLGAMSTNPIRDTTTINREAKKVRALTLDEQYRVMDMPRTMKRAMELDMPDLIDWMLGTGMRIGEACAIRDDVLDLDAGTVEVNATIIRVKGKGLVVQERPKTEAGWRVLALPADLVDMVRRRRTELERLIPAVVTMLDNDQKFRQVKNPGMVFASPLGHLRDPSNTNKDLREVLDSIDCETCGHTGFQFDEHGRHKLDESRHPIRCSEGPFSWVHSHVFRKTVATRLDDAGFTARQIADVLGHSQPSMTQDVYMGRKVVSADAARVLARPAAPHLLPIN